MAIVPKKAGVRTPQQRSRRPSVNTYYRSEKISADSPFTKKTPKKPVRKFLFGFMDVIVLAILVLALAYALALKQKPLVDANDFFYHTETAYAAAAQQQFSQLKNRNKLTFDEAAVTRALEAQFPEINDIQVELPFFSEQPVIHLAIAKPSFILNSNGSDLVVDTSGVAVAPVSGLHVHGLPVVDDKSGFPAEPGQQVMSSASVGFINTLIAECRKAKVPIASLSLPQAPEELQLRTKDSDYFVKFYLGGDALQQTGQFLAARQRFIQTHSQPSQYLDARISGKIFYK